MAEARWEEEEDGSYRYYYSDGTMATGWMSDGSDWYYLYGDGKMATGWISWKGDWYYLYSGGSMARNGPIYDSTYNNGFDLDSSTGKMVNGTGWLHDGITGDWYYYSDGSMICNGIIDEYRLDSNGKMVTGTGWVNYDEDNWCYLYDNGSMAWGRTVGGCYLNDKGEWVQGGGWQKEKENDDSFTYYYVWSNGTVATGWQQIGNKWYYFDDDGKMQTGWINDNSNWYYLDSSGAMVTGKNDIGKDTYYFYSTGEMATGWVKPGNTWYYYYGDGSLAHDRMIGEYYINPDGEWEPSKDNSNTPENIDSSNSQGTSDIGRDNSWKEDCLERGWGPLTKEEYDKKVEEAKAKGSYFPIVHAKEFDWKKVIWGSVTGVDTVISEDTVIVSSVSKYMAKYVYNNSILTNSSSRKEAYKKMFDIGNRAEDIRVVSKTLNSGGWKSLSTKIGVGGNIIAGGKNIYDDLNNANYDDEDKNKAVTVDIVTTGTSVGATILIAAFIPGVGWAFAAGVVAGCLISAVGEFWKENWIE